MNWKWRILNRLGIERTTVYGVEGMYSTPYMTALNIGRLKFHKFHRGDADPDYHDHPWSFVTFPLTSYVEEVYDPERNIVRERVVKRFCFHYRSATFAHRVLGRWTGVLEVVPWGDGYEPYPEWEEGPIYTIVIRAKKSRRWGFWRPHCPDWVPWVKYVYEGGNLGPCPQKETAKQEDRGCTEEPSRVVQTQ